MMRWEWPQGPGRMDTMEATEDPKGPQPPGPDTPEPAQPQPRGPRAKRKYTFKMPQPALPVKSLLQQASPEEQQRAHRMATEILATWLGHKTRSEVAKELGLPVVRMKQISEAALAGMVAGLLKQPPPRAKGPTPPEENPHKLRQEIDELRKETRTLKELVTLLRDLPANKALAKPPREERPRDPKARGATGSVKTSGTP